MENHINHANPGLFWQLLFIFWHSPHNVISNSWGKNIRNYVWVTLYHFYVIHPHLPYRRQHGKQQALPVNSNSPGITREKACQESHGQGWIDVPCKSSHPERSAESVLCLGYHHVSRHKSHLPLNCTFAGFMLTLALGPLCLALNTACKSHSEACNCHLFILHVALMQHPVQLFSNVGYYLRHIAIWARSRALLLSESAISHQLLSCVCLVWLTALTFQILLRFMHAD